MNSDRALWPRVLVVVRAWDRLVGLCLENIRLRLENAGLRIELIALKIDRWLLERGL